MIGGIFISFKDGMIFSSFRIAIATFLDKVFGLKNSKVIQKPMWDCLACMSSFWTIIITQSFNIELILIVCTLNYILSYVLNNIIDDEDYIDI